jgi:hypothetical protein
LGRFAVLTLLIVLASSLFVAAFIIAMRREMRAFYERARVAFVRERGRTN